MVEAIVASMVGGALIFAVGVLTGSSLTLRISAGLARGYDSVIKKVIRGDPGPQGPMGMPGRNGRDCGEEDE